MHSNKLDNVDVMEKYLERYTVQKLTLEEIYHLNRPIVTKRTELVITHTHTKTHNEKPRPRWFHSCILQNI